nr:MFS transporter [Rhodococcus sp. (in: high G+C Gram-positive bacteria)]
MTLHNNTIEPAVGRPTAPRTVRSGTLLAVLCTASFISTLDVFIVNVGLRAIGDDVNVSSLADLSWILNAYAIVFGALLVPAGRLADRYGVKQGFLLGLVLFTVGSLGCAISGDLWWIVALRCLQAVGAAALVPTSLGLILTAIPDSKREGAIKIWSVSGSLGAAAGPAIGGLLVHLSWRWIFLLNVPIGIIALIAAAQLAPSVKHAADMKVPDILGGLLLVAASASLTLSLVQGPTWGWDAKGTLTGFVATAVAAGAFTLRSRHASSPLIDSTLFAERSFTWGSLASLVLGVSFSIQLLGLTLWLQEGWGWSALQTGLGIAPGPVMVSVTALGLRRFTARVPQGWLAATGAVLMGAGGLLIGLTLDREPHYLTDVLPGWLIVGGGVGLALPTLVSAASAGLTASQTSTGSAIVQMGRQIGSVLGVAILVIVLGTAAAGAGLLDRFVEAWWWAAGLSLLAAFCALPLNPRRKSRTERALAEV